MLALTFLPFLYFQVIYLDSDIILLEDIEKMWRLFDQFAPTAVSRTINYLKLFLEHLPMNVILAARAKI